MGRDTTNDYKSALAVEKAVDILFLLAEEGEMPLGAVADGLNIGRSAAHRILTALRRKGLLEQAAENGVYTLAWGILALTKSFNRAADLRSVALPVMADLGAEIGETVTLNVRSHFNRVCIDQVEGAHEIRWRSEIGRVSPLYAGATGRVFLAHMSEDERAAYFRDVERRELTPYTLVEQTALERDLKLIRRRGYAIATQDRVLGVAGAAAPICVDGAAVAALTLAGPSSRCTAEALEEMAPLLVTAASEIGSRLEAAAAPLAVTAAVTHETLHEVKP